VSGRAHTPETESLKEWDQDLLNELVFADGVKEG
jgi:hypothetical protein